MQIHLTFYLQRGCQKNTTPAGRCVGIARLLHAAAPLTAGCTLSCLAAKVITCKRLFFAWTSSNRSLMHAPSRIGHWLVSCWLGIRFYFCCLLDSSSAHWAYDGFATNCSEPLVNAALMESMVVAAEQLDHVCNTIITIMANRAEKILQVLASTAPGQRLRRLDLRAKWESRSLSGAGP